MIHCVSLYYHLDGPVSDSYQVTRRNTNSIAAIQAREYIMRKALKIIGVILLTIIVGLFVAKLWADKTYFNDYDPTLPFNVQVKEVTRVEDTVDLFGCPPRRFEKLLFSIEATGRDAGHHTLPVERPGKHRLSCFGIGQGSSKKSVPSTKRVCIFFDSPAGRAEVEGGVGWRGLSKVTLKTINDTAPD